MRKLIQIKTMIYFLFFAIIAIGIGISIFVLIHKNGRTEHFKMVYSTDERSFMIDVKRYYELSHHKQLGIDFGGSTSFYKIKKIYIDNDTHDLFVNLYSTPHFLDDTVVNAEIVY